MARLGYICDGCGDEYNHRDPAAAVQDSELNWLDLCSGCYDEWDAGNRQEVLQS
ncbi:hypothetical protein [Haloarcula sp. JP-L23]|uniref:hypothetical protein n=1 Tax=Haloarcula sp. JP-L23 TaxID=2716717 RepID=UPI00140EE325|nr:hypothetical protein G9465_24840 [Haloarcula sp. JP-L23]